jgi:eukaryotic-like serine/threonine-protein kinase
MTPLPVGIPVVETNRTLQRYKLLEEVGQGGMAVVYKGLDTTLNREVAVKVLHPHLAGQAESRARLQREAHAVAKLRHENILEIFDYSGPDSPDSYIVTEFIHGKTLKNFLHDHPLPFPEVAEMIASEVARALEHAHQFGVIHRDVKPENVMIRDDGLLKLMDFGIAQIVDKERMTVTGQLLGSPAYMAPEHVEGRPLDFRTDVFAVGIITYQLATGQLPFRGKNPHEVLKKIADCKFAPPEAVNPLVGARLGRMIKKALARDPGDRFPDVTPLRKELVDDLAEVGIDDPRAELRKFFADPKGWAKAFRPQLVERLTERGRVLAKKGRTAAALELWGRALALEPKSSELKTLVDGVARRRKLGAFAGFAAGGLLLVAGVGLGVRAWMNRPQPPPAAEVVAKPEVARTATGAGPVAPPRSEEPKREEPRRHVVRPLIAKKMEPPPAPAPRRVVDLVPTPKAVRVSLDGKTLGDFGPKLARMELEPGEHTFTFESPFCFEKSVKVGAGESPARIVAHLDWKPATITIQVQPANADVEFENRPLMAKRQTVPIPDSSLDGRREVTVKASAPGYESQELKVRVRAAEEKPVNIELKPRAE